MNAVISVKVLDKSKIFEVKAELEAEINQGAISGGITGKVNIEKNDLSSSTETTISVSWSGGGRIKPSGEKWTIEVLKDVAAAFPDMVAITPQRTYAILTKYTSLESFHRHKSTLRPLTYENAGVYTSSLMERYMDYKSLWKQISSAIYELESNRASIEIAHPSQDVYDLAKVLPLPNAQIEKAEPKQPKAIENGQNNTRQSNDSAAVTDNAAVAGTGGAPAAQASAGTEATSVVPSQPEKSKPNNQLALLPSSAVKIDKDGVFCFSVFPARFTGLIEARQVCRWEMAKIVNEVDLVADNPTLATDGRRDLFFLNPLIFKQLLPVVRSMSAQDAIMDVKNPNAALLLGYCKPERNKRTAAKVHELQDPLEKHNPTLIKSIQQQSHKADDYRMIGCAGQIEGIHSTAEFFNDLETLDATHRPAKLELWTTDGQLSGIRITYTNSVVKAHGATTVGTATATINLDHSETEVITEIQVEEGSRNGRPEILSLSAATSLLHSVTSKDEVKPPGAADSGKTPTSSQQASSTKSDTSPSYLSKEPHHWSKSDHRQWSLRGFFGFSLNGRLLSLGTIWGKDLFVPVPEKLPRVGLAKRFLEMTPPMRKKTSSILITKDKIVNDFYIGRSVATGTSNESSVEFNALDELDVGWNIKTLQFGFTEDRRLTGIKVTYGNGVELQYGTIEKDDGDIKRSWTTPEPTDLSRTSLNPIVGIKIECGSLRIGKRDSTKDSGDGMEGSGFILAGDKGDSAPIPENSSLVASVEKRSPSFIDKVDLIMLDKGGSLPEWPLDLAIEQYMGHKTEKSESYKDDGDVVMEMAPTFNRDIWTLRGFYGETTNGVITRLGPIWGCGT